MAATTTTLLDVPLSASPDAIEDTTGQKPSSTSAAAYLSAPPTAPSTHSRSASSSTHTLSPHTARDPESVNPLHALAFGHGKDRTNSSHSLPQEVHIVKVTDDRVQIRTGPVPEPFFAKVGAGIVRAVPDRILDGDRQSIVSDGAGPPPPSPPASHTEHEQDDNHDIEGLDKEGLDVLARPTHSAHTPSPKLPATSYTPPPGRPVTFEDPAAVPSGSSARQFAKSPSRLSHTQSLSHRSSAETKSSLTSRTNRITRTLTNNSDTGIEVHPHSHASEDGDGYLHPPNHKYTRRNTIGSAAPVSVASTSSSSPRPPPARGASMHVVHPSYEAELDADLGELATDIQQQAEQIRKERISRRAKAAQEAEQEKANHHAEKALTRTASLVRAFSNKEEGPLVGNLIGEGHVNYVLMYNMLTGIRIAVSRWQAKLRRPLVAEDFTAAHKYSFDIVGNELTPSAKYDFKFKDYAPWVFRELRENYFHLDPADYLLSLTAKYILSELGSPGKSGSFFYFSRDYRFIIKTIHHTEHKFLRRILPEYYQHVKANPHTLLSRFYGLHRVKLPRGRKIHFVIMNNLFPPHKDVHETYDLKGSTVGREYPEAKARENPRAVLKDLNWINRGRQLELGPEKRALLTEQLRRDSELLKQLHVMDYSLLVGIHNVARGNKDNVRRNTLKVFSPAVPMIKRKPTQVKGPSSPEAIAMRRLVRESDVQNLESIQLPEEDHGERQHLIFYQEDGGIRATDEENNNLDHIYYLGIIDILTPYNTLKKMEHVWKGLSADIHKISPVPPTEYADRFFSFMKAIMRGGGGGERFKSE